MARPEAAPNQVRPVKPTEFTPTVVSYKAGEAHIGWQETFDHDNQRLTYTLYRDYVSLEQSRPISTATSDSSWFDRHTMSFIDRGLTPGRTYDYLVIATDPLGNRRASDRTSVTIASATQVYGDAVLKDGPDHYVRFAGGPGSLDDVAGGADATSLSGVSLANGSPTQDSGDRVGSFDGGTNAYTAARIQNAAPNDFTVEAWIKTTDGSGGRIVGYSTNYQFNSTWTDRHLYLDNTGRIRFGVDSRGSSKVTIASGNGYADGKWHHVAASLSAAGMKLYVDGQQVAQNAAVTEGRRMTGSWRMGKDTMSGWTSAASDGQLAGQIDEVAIYPRALTATEIAEHVDASQGIAPAQPNIPPTASFTATKNGLQVVFDATASADSDGTLTDFRWDFGDGSVGTGSVAQHTYAAPGGYNVTLAVTDDHGGSAQSTVSVLVSSESVAEDRFERTLSPGWGTADLGGNWSTCSRCAVTAGVGTMSVRAGDSPYSLLSGLSLNDADVSAEVTIDRMPTGGGTYVALIPRGEGRDGYRARALLAPDGSVSATLQRLSGSSQANLASAPVSGVTFTPGTTLVLRAQAVGSSPTELRFKVWVKGQPEPVAWTVSTSDSNASWQRAGTPGVWAYVSSSASNAPATVSWDNLGVATG